MKTYVATKNAGKLAEMHALFAASPLELLTYPEYAHVVEDANTYVGNALLKARALSLQLPEAGIVAAVVADDSGLEVDALGGRPGVFSARYGGAAATWPQRRAHLLSELQGIPERERSARFVSAMALILPGGEEITAVGVVSGYIVENQRGGGGFGYDPVFLHPASGATFAELNERQKNAVSHRRAAADALLATLRERA